MQIYLLQRKGTVAYDQYDGFVVIANTPNEALSLCEDIYGWTTRDKINVSEIGIAQKNDEPRIVLGSFNAG